MNAKIISIGDEILQGQTLNTNGNFLAQRLTELSFRVDKICAIADNKIAINNVLNQNIGDYNLLLITGGLGPTSDDITKKVLCQYFDGELIENPDVLYDVKKFIQARGFHLNKNNRKQALVPSTCKVIRNRFGTAPAMLFEKNNTIVVSMPGVPFEVEQIFDQAIFPVLKKKLDFPTKCIKFIHTLGLPESILAEKLEDFENDLPDNINLAYLPSPENIKIRLTAFGGFQKRICEQIKQLSNKLKQILGNHIFGFDENNSLQAVLGKILINNNLSVSTAESCTGGLIGDKITSVPGCSAYFKGGIISYGNQAKISLLKVNPKTIDKYGAVSKNTVEEMAKGAVKTFNSDYSMAVSGIAGPDGGTNEKPVGTTWIAVASKNKVLSKKYSFGTRRDINKRKAAASAMHFLINYLKS